MECLKNVPKKEYSRLTTNCSQLKMPSSDGKYYKTDVADTEQLFRLIQSIPSPKAEDKVRGESLGLLAFQDQLKCNKCR